MATTAAIDLQIVQLPIDDLRPDPANPRTISDRELDALTRSLRKFGFVQPILARHEDKIVIGGHQRLVAARCLGGKTVPVIFLDLSAEHARLLNVALNRISGEWDEQLLFVASHGPRSALRYARISARPTYADLQCSPASR